MYGFEENRFPAAGAVIAILAAWSTLLLPGCHAVHSSSLVDISHGSPRALATSYERAVLSRQHAAILDAIAPDERPDVKPAISAYRKYREWENRATTAVASRFGAGTSEPFHKSVTGMIESTVTGGLLWVSPPGVDENSLRIEANGNGAAVLSPDHNELLRLRQVDKLWYVALGDRLQDVKAWSHMVEEMALHLAYIARGIENGSIDERNADAILSFRRGPPGMPRKEVSQRSVVE